MDVVPLSTDSAVKFLVRMAEEIGLPYKCVEVKSQC